MARQCKAARSLLSWSQQTLAERAEISKQTLADFERGARHPQKRTMRDIQQTLENAGIEFIDTDEGSGVFLNTTKYNLKVIP